MTNSDSLPAVQQVRMQLEKGYMPTKYGYLLPVSHNQRAHVFDYSRGDTRILRRVLQGDRKIRSTAEIGPGSGAYTEQIIQAVGSDRFQRYLALDISPAYLDASTKKVAGLGLTVESCSWDFESRPTRSIAEWRDGRMPIVVALYGNTLGNVESVPKSLAHLRASLAPGDWLLLSVAKWCTDQLPNWHLQPYLTPGFSAAAVSAFAAVGVSGTYTFSLSIRDRSILGKATVVTVSAGPTELMEILQPGRRIRCFVSRRFELEQLVMQLAAAGFVTQHSFQGSDYLSVAALAA